MPVHLTRTTVEAIGLATFANDGVARANVLFSDSSERTAAERGLYRLRVALLGLRPNDPDHDLERIGEALAGASCVDAADLFTARLRDLLDDVLIRVAVEQTHRDAVRGDLPHVDQTARLLRSELLTTSHWRLDARGLLAAIGMVRRLGNNH